MLSHLREVHALYLLELPIFGVAGAYEPMQMQGTSMLPFIIETDCSFVIDHIEDKLTDN